MLGAKKKINPPIKDWVGVYLGIRIQNIKKLSIILCWILVLKKSKERPFHIIIYLFLNYYINLKL